MKRTLMSITGCILLLMAWASPAMSEVEWQVLNSINLGQKPVDMLVSADKTRIYFLTDNGNILIYGANGQLKDTIEVGSDIHQIKEGPGNGTLFLLSRDHSTVKMVRVSIIEAIDTLKAPFKGKSDASVSVVVFSDFQ